MVENTDRFGLNTYSQGDTNWDHTDTVQTIDELAIERGAAADRPDSGDYDDELYLATDQQILYRWDADATDWIVEGVGSETDPLPKVWANEIDANSVSTEQIGNERHYAGAYDGDSATDRLNNTISDANAGDVIFLESESYDSITVSKRISIVGTGGYTGQEPSILTSSGETWTFNDRVYLSGLNTVAGTEIQLNENLSAVVGCALSTNADVTISEGQCRVIDCIGGNVTFESGASGGIVDACVNTAFTDNDGGNTQGDIA